MLCEYDLNASARNAPKSPHVFAQNFDYFVSGSEIDLRISYCFVSSECTPYPDHSAANPNPRKDIKKNSERILNDCLTAVHKTKQQWNETTHMERHEAAFFDIFFKYVELHPHNARDPRSTCALGHKWSQDP